MKISNLCWVTLATCMVAALPASAADASDTLTPAPSERALPSTVVPDRYIIQVAPGVSPQLVASNHAVAPLFVYTHAVRGFAATVAPGRLAALRADPRVRQVIPDRVVRAVGKPTKPTGPAPQVVPAGVAHIGATAGTLPYTGAGIGVAVVDTGIDLAHADLAVAAASYSAYGSSGQDDNGHGTHVAGTIAALNNAIDVVGVAPGATLYAVKVLDASGSGYDSSIIAGLDWVAGNLDGAVPIRVVNMSLGREGTIDDNPALRSTIAALHNAGVAVVVAAGNDPALEVSQQVPSTYPEAIAVASTTAKAGTNQYRFFSGRIEADTASYFTSDGRYDASSGIGVTVSAPGEDQEDVSKAGFIKSVGILSTRLGGGTTRMSGTSMASPHVAGVVALVLQKNPGLPVEDIRNRLRSGVTGVGTAPLNSPTSSYSFDGEREGVVNAPLALAAQ